MTPSKSASAKKTTSARKKTGAAPKAAPAKPAAKKAAAPKATKPATAKKTAPASAKPKAKTGGAKAVVAKKTPAAKPKTGTGKAAPAKSLPPKGAKAPAAAAGKRAELLAKASRAIAPGRKPEPKKAAKPTSDRGGKTAAKPAPSKPEGAKRDKSEMLRKLLAMRAEDTKRSAMAAARAARKADAANLPASVAKAAEIAHNRKNQKPGVVVQPAAAEDAHAKKAKRPKAPYSKPELRELRQILEAERDRLLKDLATINEVAASSEENMSRSFSSHQADAATDTAALETTFMTRRFEEERLQMVVHAIERLDKGTYGLCEMCSEEPNPQNPTAPFIPIGRLRAKPFARFCVLCRQVMEKSTKRGGA